MIIKILFLVNMSQILKNKQINKLEKVPLLKESSEQFSKISLETLTVLTIMMMTTLNIQ
jgi:hypothetical protein